MVNKLAGYLLVSLLSFGFFTACFHTVANAEGSPGIFAPLLNAKPRSPIYSAKLAQSPTKPPSPTPTDTPTPTPTDTPTPTPTLAPTDTPTPTPSNSPTPTPQPITQPNGTDLDMWFTKYADEYQVDRALLRGIAECESGFNTNSNYQDMYIGMYQYGESAWIGARQRMGIDTNLDLRRNAEEAIRTTAFKLKQGEKSAWPNCPRP